MCLRRPWTGAARPMRLKTCLPQRLAAITPCHRQPPMRPRCTSPRLCAPVRAAHPGPLPGPLCADVPACLAHGARRRIWQEQRGMTRWTPTACWPTTWFAPCGATCTRCTPLCAFGPWWSPMARPCTWPGSSPTTTSPRPMRLLIRRFTQMRWAILTPDASVRWDGQHLHTGPGAQRSDAPPPDARRGAVAHRLPRHIFNPARLKLTMMKGNAHALLAQPARGRAHHRAGADPRTSAARRWWRPRPPCRAGALRAKETRA